MVERLALPVQRLMLRTGQGRLRRAWSAAYELLFRAIGIWLRHGDRGGVFVGGSFASREPVFGVSDVDLIAVLAGDPSRPGRARERAHERWKRLCRAVPPLCRHVGTLAVYEGRELEELISSTCLTYGLDGEATRAAFYGSDAPPDEGGLLVRPGLAPTHGWRLVSGSDRRPANVATDAQRRRIHGWLELQFWWRFAFAACADPASPGAAFMAVKLVAEPARIWLWLVQGEQVSSRSDVMRRALEALPDERDTLRRALPFRNALPRSPVIPLPEALAYLLRLSSKIAGLIEDELANAGATEVRLIGAGSELVASRNEVAPLVDWRARVLTDQPDETIVLCAGEPDDPGTLSEAAETGDEMLYQALRSDGLLVLPALSAPRTQLRSVQCAATDPVSFALLAGTDVAAFPNVAGWSAHDCAARAVAEHKARLGRGAPSPARSIGRLLAAARAALFLESVEAGRPELTATASATAELLGRRQGGGRSIAQEAFAAYRSARLEGTTIAPETVSALARLVESLPHYAR